MTTVASPRPARSHASHAPVPDAPTSTTIVWSPVDGVQSAVWVGRFRDRFVGMIEARWGRGFAVTTRLGQGLGMFPTLEAAQRAFEDRLRKQI